MQGNKDEFSENLRFLCSRERSITAAAERIGIHRQQLNKYLAGTNMPSMRTVRKISEGFFVDDRDLFLPADEFRAMIDASQKMLPAPSDLVNMFKHLHHTCTLAADKVRGATGVYFCYERAEFHPCFVECSLLVIQSTSTGVRTSRLFSSSGLPGGRTKLKRANGVIYSLNDNLTWVETNSDWEAQPDINVKILYPNNQGDLKSFVGHSLGHDPRFANKIRQGPTAIARQRRRMLRPSMARNIGVYPFEETKLDPHLDYHLRPEKYRFDTADKHSLTDLASMTSQ